MRRFRQIGLLASLGVFVVLALSIEAAAPAPRPIPAVAEPRLAGAGNSSSSPGSVGRIGGAIGGTSAGTITRSLGDPTRPPAPSSLTGYVWPLPRGRITQPFGPSPWGSHLVDGKPFHDGIDLATFCDDRIVAAHSGIVLAAGHSFDQLLGWVGDLTPYINRMDARHLWSTLPLVVVIDDGNGYRSIYAHFWRLEVKPGDRVRAGQEIGREGMTGHATGCHLHYGIFSPLETDTFASGPEIGRLLLPDAEIARIDPLDVLPPRPSARAIPLGLARRLPPDELTSARPE